MFECPTCLKQYKSYKSLHRHKTLKHPDTIGEYHKNLREEYDRNPQLCKCCNTPLPYSKRSNVFCNSSCSATYNNRQATNDTKSKRIDTWRSKLGTLNRDQPKLYPKQKPCVTCGIEFAAVHTNHIYCSTMCNTSKWSKVSYRTACRFQFNPTDHYDLYDFELINRVGWYTPSNKGEYNPNGVCWDHLYRVEEGYANNVCPSIMSHPANAEMVTWTENISRKESMISYEELLDRIHQWELNH